MTSHSPDIQVYKLAGNSLIQVFASEPSSCFQCSADLPLLRVGVFYTGYTSHSGVHLPKSKRAQISSEIAPLDTSAVKRAASTKEQPRVTLCLFKDGIPPVCFWKWSFPGPVWQSRSLPHVWALSTLRQHLLLTRSHCGNMIIESPLLFPVLGAHL